jgi:hypothetical protein
MVWIMLWSIRQLNYESLARLFSLSIQKPSRPAIKLADLPYVCRGLVHLVSSWVRSQLNVCDSHRRHSCHGYLS